MADISISGGTRPKLATTLPLSLALVGASPVYNDTDNIIETYYRIEDLNPPSFTVASVTTTSGNATITTTGNGFANVRVGDAVTGTGIGVGAVVQTKTNNNSLVLSVASTAGGTITATFDPPTFDATLFGIKHTLTLAGNSLSVTAKLYKFSGAEAANLDSGSDGLDFDADSAETASEASDTIDLDAFLQSARVPRVNS